MHRFKQYGRVLLAAAVMVFCGVWAGPSQAGIQQEPLVRKAVFVIVDGIPADVIERVPTPNIDAIAGKSGYTRSFVGGIRGTESEVPTVSAPGYANLLTGVWANKHNVTDNQIEHPDYSYWDIFRMVKNDDPDRKTAIFSTWLDNRTKLLGDGLPAAGGDKFDYHFDGFEHDEERFPHDFFSGYIHAIDKHVSAEAARYINVEGPDLSFVYLQYTDDVAHFYGDGEDFDKAVRLADQQVGAIWKSVQARQQQGEDWLMLVTTDHGRNDGSGRGHGGQSDRERTTWIATNSARLNARFPANPPIVDILPSVITHLGVVVPEMVWTKLDGASFID